MQDKIEYFLWVSLSRLIRLIGLPLSRKVAFLMTVLFYFLIPIRKSTVKDNLKKAFPSFNKHKINMIAFGSYKSFMIAFLEILYLPVMEKSEIQSVIEFNNLSFIKEKYNEGKGVILLGAHFGNWEYLALSGAAQADIPFSVIVKPQRNNLVTNWLDKQRVKFDNKIVPLGISVRQIYKELKDKKIVAMVADQRGPEEGIRINFMGRKAAVYPGPAILALKTGAPIIFGVAVRQPDFTYKTELEIINTDNLPENEELKVIELSQRHTNALEKYITMYPEQWLWMHKRWKY
jgi:KDO2-lipid IV(A) lauroyltransferase